MIHLEDVCYSIAGRSVLKNINLYLAPGTAFALCGPNGAGKTTLIRIILGLLRKGGGEVKLGVPRGEVSFMFHSTCLFENLSLMQNYRFFMASRGKDVVSSRLDYWSTALGIKDVLNKRTGTLSEGMRQKADLVRVLIEEPGLMILDEPTANMDPCGKIRVREILSERVSAGCSLLLTSHLLGEVEKLANQAAFLKAGTIIWSGKTGNDLNGPDLESKYMHMMAAMPAREA